MNASIIHAYDELLRDVSGRLNPGCSCAVAQGEKILYEGYAGVRDLSAGAPVTENTVFRHFSTTKLYTVTAAMMLFERGKFLMLDPISDYLPEWKNVRVAEVKGGKVFLREPNRPVTVRDCLTMGIGMVEKDLVPYGFAQLKKDMGTETGKCTLRELVRAAAEIPMVCDPGAEWHYGFGHDLIAAMIEVADGRDIETFMREELFEPLGLLHTSYRHFEGSRENMVVPYRRDSAGSFTVMPLPSDARLEKESRFISGGAGIISDTRDFLVFCQMLAAGGTWQGRHYLNRRTIDLMRRPQLSDAQMQDYTRDYLQGYSYGYGVRTLVDGFEGNLANPGEFGWSGYLGTYAMIDPKAQLSVVFMQNTMPNNERYIHPRIRNMAYALIDS